MTDESDTASYQTTLTGSTQTRVGHWKHDDYDVYVGRGERGNAHMNNTQVGERGWLGNPYPKEEYGRAECIERFREDFEKRLDEDSEFRASVRALAEKMLGCWCQRINDDGPRCHGEVIAEWADRLQVVEGGNTHR